MVDRLKCFLKEILSRGRFETLCKTFVRQLKYSQMSLLLLYARYILSIYIDLVERLHSISFKVNLKHGRSLIS